MPSIWPMHCLLYRSLVCQPNNYSQKRHLAVGKETGQSNQIEILTTRVPKNLSFGQKDTLNGRKIRLELSGASSFTIISPWLWAKLSP